MKLDQIIMRLSNGIAFRRDAWQNPFLRLQVIKENGVHHFVLTSNEVEQLKWCPDANDVMAHDWQLYKEPTMDSTSDDRVKNNVMRHEYRVLSDVEKEQMRMLKDKGLEFIELCDAIGSSRELALAKTNAEQAVMWAVKHVTN